MRTADVVMQYSPDPRAVLVGFIPDAADTTGGVCNAVILLAHGGGWVAQTNVNSWRHDPTYTLTLPAFWLALGVAVFWIEYPYGWHAVPGARWQPSSRYPQIPRAMGQAIQFLKTHANDGIATGRVDIQLPTAAERYWFNGNSAGSVMAANVALQPDGWLPYDFTRTRKGRFDYTFSHRVGGVFAYDCATDLRKYDGSPSALPYYGPSTNFYGSSHTAVVGDQLDRFASIDNDLKYASSAISLVEKRYPENLDVVLYLSNAVTLREAGFLHSGMTIQYATGDLTLGPGSAPPVVGETVIARAAGGGSPTGAQGTLRRNSAITGGGILHIDRTAGTVLQWGQTSATAIELYCQTSGAVIANVISGGGDEYGNGAVIGNDAFPTHLSEAALLSEWDVDEFRLATTSEHSANYLPALKRARQAHFDAASRTNTDCYFIGNAYVAQLNGYNAAAFPYRLAAFPWCDLDQNTIEAAVLVARGVLSP
jgi:hypothetical protein